MSPWYTAVCVHIVLDKPQRAVTPGQAIVRYDGDVALAGATIGATVSAPA